MAEILLLDAAAKLDIIAKQGDDLYFKVNVTELNTDTEEYDAFDFTTYTVKMQVKTSGKSGYPVLYFSSADSTITLTDGLMEFKQTYLTMAAMLPGKYVYDVQFSNTVDDSSKTYMKGSFELRKEITT